MTTPTSTSAPSRRLFWVGTALLGVAWIALFVAAVMGGPAPWPNWVGLVAITGQAVGGLLLPRRPKAYDVLMVVTVTLSVVATIAIILRMR